MHLESFRVKNFRSVNDSGDVAAARITSLLGRNESGKSNLLKALHSLNPSGGVKALSPIKDFPRHRRIEECKDDTPVLSTRWKLTEKEKQELGAILPRAVNVDFVTVGRSYGTTRTVGFEGLMSLAFEPSEVKAKVRKIVPAVKSAAASLSEETKKAALEVAADTFETSMAASSDKSIWADSASKALAAIRQALAAADTELTEKQDHLVIELEDLALEITNDKGANEKARRWVIEKLPKFILVDEYPELHGHQNLTEYLSHKSNSQLTLSEESFEKLCKVAGLDPQQLQDLFSKNDQETRNQLANRAGSVITAEIRRLWKDRALKVRFNLDAHHLDTLISDPNATYEVEVNLNERSRGFQWFFSFYVSFCADTKDGDAVNAILLLDEPGLYLHARSQTDLLTHLEKDFENQIIYTTHSPFMVPTHKLDWVRTVSIDENIGTTVSNNPSGDSRTLFPLQAALGYSIAQSLFIGANNLVVEGITDFWILSSVSAYLNEHGREGLDDSLTITPAGGAQRVSYMVALLSSESLNVLVLLDHEKEAIATRLELLKSKLISDKNVLFVSEAFGTSAPSESDIEDLIDPSVYESLVKEAYSKELSEKTLALNNDIPRIAKRVDIALNDIGIKFNKTLPARLFLNKLATSPEGVLPDSSLSKFELLFKTVNTRLKKLVTS